MTQWTFTLNTFADHHVIYACKALAQVTYDNDSRQCQLVIKKINPKHRQFCYLRKQHIPLFLTYGLRASPPTMGVPHPLWGRDREGGLKEN